MEELQTDQNMPQTEQGTEEPSAPESGGSNKGIIIAVIVVVVIAFIAGAVYIFMTGSPAPVEKTIEPIAEDSLSASVGEQAEVIFSPDDDTSVTIEKELNAVDLGNIDADLNEIDQDIESL